MSNIDELRMMHESGERRFTTDRSILRDIMAADPDGDDFRTTAPTEAEYDGHMTWAVMTYGQTAWDDYLVGGWGESSGGEWV